MWVPGDADPIRTFDSEVAEFVYLVALDRAHESNGDRRAPTGWFALLDLTPGGSQGLLRQHLTESTTLGLTQQDVERLQFVLVQDRAREPVRIKSFQDADALSAAYEQLEDAYARWLMDQRGITFRDLGAE